MTISEALKIKKNQITDEVIKDIITSWKHYGKDGNVSVSEVMKAIGAIKKFKLERVIDVNTATFTLSHEDGVGADIKIFIPSRNVSIISWKQGFDKFHNTYLKVGNNVMFHGDDWMAFKNVFMSDDFVKAVKIELGVESGEINSVNDNLIHSKAPIVVTETQSRLDDIDAIIAAANV